MRARPLVILAVIAAAAASRLLPHPPNFTPIAAMALFGGAHFADRRLAFALPLAAMFVSDLFLGFHQLMPLVYAAFVLTTIIGLQLRVRKSAGRITAATLASSVLFYVVTNFGVWAWSGLYPKSVDGLVTAYLAALPFFRNTAAGDLFYVVVLFGGVAVLERIFPVLREFKTPGRPA